MSNKLSSTCVVLNQSCTSLPVGDNRIDAVVTDPPYELNLQGNAWDRSGISFDPEMWGEMLRVLKPGGYAGVFMHPKTQHRVVSALEDAGFIIQDLALWVYSGAITTGRAVARDIDRELGKPRVNDRKAAAVARRLDAVTDAAQLDFEYDTPNTELAAQYEGFHTQLRPGHEPICIAQKPLTESTVAKNIIRWGTGAMNIGESRIPYRGNKPKPMFQNPGSAFNYFWKPNERGRYTMNILFDRLSAELMDLQCGRDASQYFHIFESEDTFTLWDLPFFYCDKASKPEREFGCDELDAKARVEVYNNGYGGKGENENVARNWHPSVKPVGVMAYVCNLLTPPDGTVLDPFMGSGSTGLAALAKRFKFLGVELSEEFFTIAVNRLRHMVSFVEHCDQLGLEEVPLVLKGNPVGSTQLGPLV